MAWNRSQDDDPPATPSPTSSSKVSAAGVSTLGPSISIKGDLSGAEDLRIEGSVEGTIRLNKQSVIVCSQGKIKADIHSRSICVEGEVKGNLYGEKEIIIRPSGKLEGNITAPSVTLENGAKFRGSIDMEPTPQKQPAQQPRKEKSPIASQQPRTGAALPAGAKS